jgi:hypothetical protein
MQFLQGVIITMIVCLLCALLLAFVFGFAFGKMYIPWLRKHNASQPLKKEVEEYVYEENRNSASH